MTTRVRLAQLHDSDAADGDVATYDAALGLWVPAAPSGGGGGGGSGGGLLQAAYANPSGGVVTKTFPITTFSAVSTSLLRATFTAPASGHVVVKVGGGRLNQKNANPHFGILNGATLVASACMTAGVSTGSPFWSLTASFRVTGLTSGASVSYDFAVCDTNQTSASTLQYGYTTSNFADATAAAFIEVWEAP